MHRFSDQQICTLFFVAKRNPPPPGDMSRFPNVRLFLAAGLIEQINGKLRITDRFPMQEYESVTYPGMVPSDDDQFQTFEDLERADRLDFSPVEPTPQHHTFRIHTTLMLKQALAKVDCVMGPLNIEGQCTITRSEDPEKQEAAERLLAEYFDSGEGY